MSKQELIVNGRSWPHRGEGLTELLAGMDLPADGRGVAVAVNGVIVPRERWREVKLNPGDEVDVVGAVHGG